MLKVHVAYGRALALALKPLPQVRVGSECRDEKQEDDRPHGSVCLNGFHYSWLTCEHLYHILCVYICIHTHMEYTSHSERVSVRMSGSRQKELRQNPNKNPGIHAQESSTARLDTFLASKPKWMCPTLLFLSVWGACTPHAEFWTRVNFSKSPSAGTVFASLFAQSQTLPGKSAYTCTLFYALLKYISPHRAAATSFSPAIFLEGFL